MKSIKGLVFHWDSNQLLHRLVAELDQFSQNLGLEHFKLSLVYSAKSTVSPAREPESHWRLRLTEMEPNP